MKAIAVIPARLASTRLPRKMLREIAGKPLIGMVYEAVRSSPLLAEVVIATDSEEIMEVCRQRGWNAQMTSASHRSGTERVHEVSGRDTAYVYINVSYSLYMALRLIKITTKYFSFKLDKPSRGEVSYYFSIHFNHLSIAQQSRLFL